MAAHGSVLCVAVNGYDRVYADCLRSHRRYARKRGMEYVTITAPGVLVDRADAAWAKLELLHAELKRGTPWVMLVDSDCKIRSSTPKPWSVEESFRDIYAAKGHSGRWNSGVLIFWNQPDSVWALERILKGAETPVPESEWNGWTDWGENAHVIHELDKYDGVKELDWRWNNSHDSSARDFIRHFTGPLSLKDDRRIQWLKKRAQEKSAAWPPLQGNRDERLKALVELADRWRPRRVVESD